MLFIAKQIRYFGIEYKIMVEGVRNSVIIYNNSDVLTKMSHSFGLIIRP
jgi:hypothetical protein